MGTLPDARVGANSDALMTWEDLETRVRPLVSASLREKLLRLLIRAVMGSSNPSGF